MKILVAEDEPVVRELMRRALRATGWEVAAAENGQVALEMLRNMDIDLLITDIKMPKISGLELLRRLRQEPRTANVPVIVCTNYPTEGTVLEAEDLGALRYLAKPIAPETLRQKVAEVFQQPRSKPKRTPVNPIRHSFSRTSPPPAFDRAKALARLEITPDDYRDLLILFVESAHERLQEMGAHVERGEAGLFRQVLQELRMTAESLSAKGVGEALLKASIILAQGDEDLRRETLLHLKAELERLRKAAQELGSLKVEQGANAAASPRQGERPCGQSNLSAGTRVDSPRERRFFRLPIRLPLRFQRLSPAPGGMLPCTPKEVILSRSRGQDLVLRDSAQTQDLGAGGLCLVTESPLEKGDELLLELRLGLSWLKLAARVVWTEPVRVSGVSAWRAGVEFAETFKTERSQILRFLFKQQQWRARLG